MLTHCPAMIGNVEPYTLGVTAEIQLGLWCCDGVGRISEGVSLGEGRIRRDAHCVQTLSRVLYRVFKSDSCMWP